jgi:hypothetical protein
LIPVGFVAETVTLAVFYAGIIPPMLHTHLVISNYAIYSSFGGPEVACCPLQPKFVGSNPAEAVGFFRTKNPQYAFLRKGQ